jgi:hypothetical protein
MTVRSCLTHCQGGGAYVAANATLSYTEFSACIANLSNGGGLFSPRLEAHDLLFSQCFAGKLGGRVSATIATLVNVEFENCHALGSKHI